MRRVVALVCCLASMAALAACEISSAESRTVLGPTACSAGQVPDPGTQQASLGVDGEQRSYMVHVPDGYDGQHAMPVVYLLHGMGGSAEAFATSTDFLTLADREGLVVVAPQGRSTGTLTGWNYTAPVTQPGSDAAFVKRLTTEIDRRFCIDDNRQYLAGFSNGSLLTFAIACSGAFDFAAYGGVSAIGSADGCAAPPEPVIYVHGTADAVIPYHGGQTVLGPMTDVAGRLQTWVAHNGCGTPATLTQVSPHVEEQAWTGCVAAGDITAYIITNGGHAWPGSPDLKASFVGTTSDEIDATDLLWAFFQKHRR